MLGATNKKCMNGLAHIQVRCWRGAGRMEVQPFCTVTVHSTVRHIHCILLNSKYSAFIQCLSPQAMLLQQCTAMGN